MDISHSTTNANLCILAYACRMDKLILYTDAPAASEPAFHSCFFERERRDWDEKCNIYMNEKTMDRKGPTSERLRRHQYIDERLWSVIGDIVTTGRWPIYLDVFPTLFWEDLPK